MPGPVWPSISLVIYYLLILYIDNPPHSLSEGETSYFGKNHNEVTEAGPGATVAEAYIVYQNIHINSSLHEKTKANLKNQTKMYGCIIPYTVKSGNRHVHYEGNFSGQSKD